MALLEARVAETTLQRSQLEELIQNLSRSRDESVLAEVDSAVRVAMQQAAITGSAEPLVLTLRQADERLARYNQPRLERVRRAVLQDLERTRTAGITDIALLTVRLDDVIRQVDGLPLWAQPARAQALARGRAPQASAPAPAPAAVIDAGVAGPDRPEGVSAAAPATQPSAAGAGEVDPAPTTEPGAWAALWARLGVDGLQRLGQQLWQEVRGLVRVSRIDQPEAMLVAPEQAWFLRENLKLRLLNARLALMSRQFDTAQADLRDAQAALERYFDGESQRVQGVQALVSEVTAQARLVNVPRPEATLAAIAAVTATAGR
jgi:uroporphyrin-3 C-methyltransferase